MTLQRFKGLAIALFFCICFVLPFNVFGTTMTASTTFAGDFINSTTAGWSWTQTLDTWAGGYSQQHNAYPIYVDVREFPPENTGYHSISKNYLTFDTRAFAGVISAATLYVKRGTGIYQNGCGGYDNHLLWIRPSSQSSISSINTAEWANTNTTKYNNGGFYLSSLTANTYVAIPLNSYGIAAIQKGNYTQMQVGFDDDILRQFNHPCEISTDAEILDVYLSVETTIGASITITNPPSGSSTTTNFIMSVDYNTMGEDWQRIMIIPEIWAASSTCPDYGTETWNTETNAGWFLGGSLPSFSPFFTTSSGSLQIPMTYLEPNKSYNCVHCFMINEANATNTPDLCGAAYSFNTGSFSFSTSTPTYYYPLPGWNTYYASNSNRWTTSTPFFNTVAGVASPIIQWIGNFSVAAKNFFSATSSSARGAQIGQAIPVLRGYLTIVDDFFGGLPISGLFSFFALVCVMLIAYRLIISILNIFKSIRPF